MSFLHIQDSQVTFWVSTFLSRSQFIKYSWNVHTPPPFNQDKQNNNIKKRAAEKTELICTLMNIILFQQTYLFGSLEVRQNKGIFCCFVFESGLAKTN